ncbi:hypothetical protein ACJX0J_033666, partial [Zea mays]
MIACVHAICIIIHDLLSHRIMPNKIAAIAAGNLFGVAQIPLPLASMSSKDTSDTCIEDGELCDTSDIDCITIDKFHLHAGLKGSNRVKPLTLTHEVSSCNLQMFHILVDALANRLKGW